jgi:hypothetical protein
LKFSISCSVEVNADVGADSTKANEFTRTQQTSLAANDQVMSVEVVADSVTDAPSMPSSSSTLVVVVSQLVVASLLAMLL